MKNLLGFFQQDIKLKTTNPFFAAYFIVWIVRNWKFIYSLFTLNTIIPIGERFKILEVYLKSESYLLELTYCIVLALLLIIITYFFINVSRLITNLFEKRLTPLIYKISDFKKLVTKEVYVKVCNQRDQNENKYEAERDRRLKLQGDYDNLENTYQKLLTSKEKEIEETDEDDVVVLENDDLEEKEIINEIYSKIIKDEKINGQFRKVIDIIDRGKGISEDDPVVDFFARTEIVKFTNYSMGLNHYEFTKRGEKLRNRFLYEFLNK